MIVVPRLPTCIVLPSQETDEIADAMDAYSIHLNKGLRKGPFHGVTLNVCAEAFEGLVVHK